MFLIIRSVLWILVAWRWGDWRNWKKYQSTILFFILLDLLYNFLTYNYTLWQYEPTAIIPNHTFNNMIVMFIIYPCLVLLYLGRYPTGGVKQGIWIISFTTFLSIVEFINYKAGLITFHSGWNIKWSIMFYLYSLPILRLHNKKPLLAFGISVLITVGLLWILKVPISKMK
ncbi:MAG: CBO0543 family protein [Bacillota bacterium]